MYHDAEIEKVEFHVIGEDGEAFAWEPDFPSAAAYCNPANEHKVKRIDKVTYFANQSETVWPFDEAKGAD